MKNDDKNKNEMVAHLEEKLAETENNWKRALADYKNLEKRVAEEKETFASFANSVLLMRLLPIIDNLEMLEKHVDDAGVRLITKDFRQVLEDEGVEEVIAEGESFDPSVMEATGSEGDPNGENEGAKVSEVVQKGYIFNGKLLRPAKVVVGPKRKGK